MKTKEAGKQLAKLVDAADRFVAFIEARSNADWDSMDQSDYNAERDLLKKSIEETRPAVKVLKNRFP